MRFKVGDRVIATQWVGKDQFTTAVTGTVVGVEKRAETPYLVQFDENIDGHDGNSAKHRGLCKVGYGWWCRDAGIRKEDEGVFGDMKTEFARHPIRSTARITGIVGIIFAILFAAYKEWQCQMEKKEDKANVEE